MADSSPGLSDFFAHIVMMPRWHKHLLTIAAVLFGAGVVGQGAGYLSNAPARTVSPNTPADAPYVRVEQGVSTLKPKPTVTQWLSPHAIKIGVSFIIAFIVGWLARAFVKIMSLVFFVIVLALLAMSYLGIYNVDFSAIEKQYSTNAQWAFGQAQALAAAIVHHLPSSVSGGAGMWIGFRRR